MAGHGGIIAVPEEIRAQQRQRRTRLLRLYGIAAGAVLLLGAGVLAISGGFIGGAIAPNDRLADALRAAATAYTHGDYAAAEHELRAAIAVKDGYNVRYDLGVALLRDGSYAQALAEFRRAASFYSKAPSAYFYGAIAGLMMHRPAVARAEIGHALALVPADAQANAIAALADRQLGRAAAAAKESSRARAAGYRDTSLPALIAAVPFEYDEPMHGS